MLQRVLKESKQYLNKKSTGSKAGGLPLSSRASSPNTQNIQGILIAQYNPESPIKLPPVLAVDYGRRRIGLAVSDFKGILSTPLRRVEITKGKTEEDIINEIRSIALENQVKSILVGMPQAFVETHEKIRKKIRGFALKLSMISGIFVMFYDESFSTKETESLLLSLGQNRKKYRDKLDSAAAAYFLQEYLDAANKVPETTEKH